MTRAGSHASFIHSYVALLRQKYPLADPPSLIASFLILHELTAIVPLGIGFLALKQLEVGESVVNWAVNDTVNPTWATTTVTNWVSQGRDQAERIGRRYGTFGFEKETKEAKEERTRSIDNLPGPRSIAGGDVANLVASYLLVKVSPLSAELSDESTLIPVVHRLYCQ